MATFDDPEDDDMSAEPDSDVATDALTLLRDDHEQVDALFDDYEAGVDSMDDESKRALTERICTMLTVHAQIEEEIFYPEARAALDEQSVLDEAEVEHASAKDLIEQIQSMDPGDDLYDAKVKVLGEYIRHHVREEEDEMFPLVEASELDLEALGEQLHERKQELLEEFGVELTQ